LYSIATNLWKENDLKGAKQFATEGIEWAEKLKWDVGHIKGLLAIADLQAFETKYDSSAATALYALNIAERIHNENLIAIAHFSLSEDYRLMGNDSLAEYHAVKYLNAANALKNNEMILQALVNLADIYLQKKQQGKAEEIFDKALPMAIAQGNNSQLAKLLDSKADIQIKSKNFESASNYLRQELLL
jgi:tetratricopeptide (TPR) repeat protein